MISTIQEMARFLRENDDFAVITHFKPDGDAYGSALALTYILEKMGKRAFPVCDDEVEPKYRFLQGWERFTNETKGLPFTPKTAVGVDVSDEERMGASRALYAKCAKQAAIDHHASNAGFAPVTYLEAEAVAAGQLIVKIANELNVALTKPIAEQLYTAVSTDSGNFSFKDTDGETFRLTAQLLDAGADVETLSRRIFRSRTIGQTRLIGMALSSIVLSENGKVAGIMLTDEMFEKSGATRPEAHSIVNYLNEIDGVCIGLTCEQREGEVKISFRGANDTDVSLLAARFEGGGHKVASGGRVRGGKLETEFPRIMRAAEEYLREIK